MKYTEANLGRIFILRLEHGDRIPDVIEGFAIDKQIESAIVHFLGGADTGSKVVVGPEEGAAATPRPMVTELLGTSEAVGVGTLFLNEQNKHKLHLHAAFGRERETITGCTREGVQVWHIGEVVIFELCNTTAKRKVDLETGFELLETE
ncbi:PPC domain-containing DNA-binding protein [Desulfuribacillus alkaliarsenatis]|uniref:DNA-binding protein n=1 Tax=Desulfuribacillus alkaliarsenatis TaxID=766136 RepID=A0A1E5FZK8_9FIRM|nr:PPC domain-containing DNA-binding protein [Desulfuribacillus alkaliarsenatis]OEF95676.1 DNA-binding protein [Desulfuribacillus alkaliarsenatis]